MPWPCTCPAHAVAGSPAPAAPQGRPPWRRGLRGGSPVYKDDVIGGHTSGVRGNASSAHGAQVLSAKVAHARSSVSGKEAAGCSIHTAQTMLSCLCFPTNFTGTAYALDQVRFAACAACSVARRLAVCLACRVPILLLTLPMHCVPVRLPHAQVLDSSFARLLPRHVSRVAAARVAHGRQAVVSCAARNCVCPLTDSFSLRVLRDKGLQQMLSRTFVQGLETPVSRKCLFTVLRLEEEFLENRMFALLDANKNGFITLEEVLLALARAAAGETLRTTMRLHEVGQQRVGGPHEWEDSPNAVRRQAAFAFQLYDLDGNGELTAKEVAVLVTECIGGNARAVEHNIHAIGAVRNAMVDEHGFRLMALHASNFLFPAFRLQQRMAQYGQTAAEALTALRDYFGQHGAGAAPSSSGLPVTKPPAQQKKSPRRPANMAFYFGTEQETPPRPARQAHQAHRNDPSHGRDVPLPPPQVHNGGGRHSKEGGVGPGGQPRQSYRDGPPARQDDFERHPEAGPRARASQYPTEDDVAAAFRAVRLGRTADIESAVTLGSLPIDIVFQPHGATLLHVAAAHGHRSLCKRLLALGAPPDAVDALGRSAAEVALAYRHWEVSAMLRSAGVPISPEAEMHSLRERAQWEAAEAQQMRTPDDSGWGQSADVAGQWGDGGGGLGEEEAGEMGWEGGPSVGRGPHLRGLA